MSIACLIFQCNSPGVFLGRCGPTSSPGARPRWRSAADVSASWPIDQVDSVRRFAGQNGSNRSWDGGGVRAGIKYSCGVGVWLEAGGCEQNRRRLAGRRDGRGASDVCCFTGMEAKMCRGDDYSQLEPKKNDGRTGRQASGRETGSTPLSECRTPKHTPHSPSIS